MSKYVGLKCSPRLSTLTTGLELGTLVLVSTIMRRSFAQDVVMQVGLIAMKTASTVNQYIDALKLQNLPDAVVAGDVFEVVKCQ